MDNTELNNNPIPDRYKVELLARHNIDLMNRLSKSNVRVKALEFKLQKSEANKFTNDQMKGENDSLIDEVEYWKEKCVILAKGESIRLDIGPHETVKLMNRRIENQTTQINILLTKAKEMKDKIDEYERFRHHVFCLGLPKNELDSILQTIRNEKEK